jgi:L-amino acid N-acyltransferase YncA
MDIRIRTALPTDASAMAAIYNQGIEERSATFETSLRSAEDMLERIKAASRFPILVALDPGGNTASRALCRACGFREVGTYEKHAKLDDSWLDVVIVERLIPANLT